MNGKDIFLGLRYVESEFIEEAEFGEFPNRAAQTETSRKRTAFRRPFLLAALIALMLLLVGCAVVYVLNMQNLKLGNQVAEKAVYATDGRNIIGYEDINQQVLSLAGVKGSPSYQAALDWYEFKQEYDPDHQLHMELMAEDTIPEFPEEYFDYIIYTQEMKDQLDAILTEYGLKPLGYGLDFRTVKNMCTALGIEKILTAQNDVSVKVDSGFCYSNGNIMLNMDFELPADAESEISATWGVLHWNRKDCFSEDLITIEDTGDWKEWNYTTASGSEVLIIRSPSDWRGWIICDRGEAFLAVQIEVRKDIASNEGGQTSMEYQYMSDRQIELVADAIDFSIQPRKVTQEDVDNQPAASNAATQDAYTVELKDVTTDGYMAYITLGITAPEGTIITRDTREGLKDDSLFIMPGGDEALTPAVGEMGSHSCPWEPREDNDGLDNTQDFVIEAQITMSDGSAPFASGSVWNLHIENLTHSYFDEASFSTVEEILAEGEWNFVITFNEENGDYRQLELLQDPINTKACTGWTMDGKDVMGDVEISSFVLRKYGTNIVTSNPSADLVYRGSEGIRVVMKDGSVINVSDDLVDEAESPIDLDQADHVLLADGTKLSVPETP